MSSFRKTFFQTHGAAQSYALRCACDESPSGFAHELEFLRNAYQAKEGGTVFFVEPCAPGDDYSVRQLGEAEVRLRTLRGVRAAIDRHLDKAAEHEKARDESKGRVLKQLHKSLAEEERASARELQARLQGSGAHVIPVCSEAKAGAR